MKQEERREQTKRILLEATEDLIREQGAYQTTLNDIMKRSGLSKGAIFHYVSSKDELFVHVLRAKLAEQNEQFMSEVNKQGDIKQFDGPMNTIINSMSRLESRDDVSNLIFMYLIGKAISPKSPTLWLASIGKRQPLRSNGLSQARKQGLYRNPSMRNAPPSCSSCCRSDCGCGGLSA